MYTSTYCVGLTGNVTYKINFATRSLDKGGPEKKMSVTYSECVPVALSYTAYKPNVPHYIVSFVACPALPYFPHYLISGVTLKKNVIEHKICVLIFYTSFV
jgi:hypothetical protein